MRLHPSPTERTTAATDALLALLALIYALKIARDQPASYRAKLWAAAFGQLSAAAALGAVAHGIAMSETRNRQVWLPLNTCLAVAVALFAGAAVADRHGQTAARRALPPLLGAGGLFVAFTRVIPGTFALFLAYEALALLYSLGVYAQLARHGTLRGAHQIAAGIVVSLVAAAIQASPLKARILGLPFDHNGLFHLVQLAGLPLLAQGIRAGERPL